MAKHKFETMQIHVGQENADPATDARAVPIYATTPCLLRPIEHGEDIKSLYIHPASTTHSQLSEKELADAGIKPNTIRLSIGTEHIDDIIADLEHGFCAVKQ